MYIVLCLMKMLFTEIKIQPELNSKLIPPHYRGEIATSLANSSTGGSSSAVDSSEGAAAAAVNEN